MAPKVYSFTGFYRHRLVTTSAHTVPLTSKLTLTCGNMCVFLYFCRVTQSELACDTRVNLCVEHASSLVHYTKSIFVYCNHASNTSCAARQSVFLCAAHKLTAITYQKRIKAYNEIAC